MQQEPNNKRLFHLHVDGLCLPLAAAEYMATSVFEETPFCKEMMGDGFEAPHHFTLKTTDPRTFKSTFEDTVAYLSKTEFEGYVEGECIAYDMDIEHSISEPVSLENLSPEFSDLNPGEFRETELHITLKHHENHKAVAALKRIGFFSAFMDKPFGLAEILTVQGSKRAIGALENHVIRFLQSRDDISDCSIKREDIAKFWLSDPNVKRAQVMQDLEINQRGNVSGK